MRVSFFRRFLSFFSVLLILIVALLVPISAYPASFSDAYLFPMFHMNFVSSVYYQSTEDEIKFQVPLPSIPYYFEGERNFYSSTDLIHIDDNVNLDVNQDYSLSGLTPSSDPSNEALLNFDFMLETFSDVGSSYFSGDSTIYFQQGYLSPDFSMNTEGDSAVFKAYQSVERNSVAAGTLLGQFSFTSDPYTTYTAYLEDGLSVLSYYYVLYNSNFDFLSNLPENIDPVQWQLAYNHVADYDFSDLTPSQINTLRLLFGWCGTIYGDFGLDLDYEFHEYAGTNDFHFSYLLTNKDEIDHFHEEAVEDASYSGLTGFERVTKFLGSAVQGFFSVEILPDFSLGSIVVVLVSFSLVLWWLKVFAGG